MASLHSEPLVMACPVRIRMSKRLMPHLATTLPEQLASPPRAQTRR
ncbi:hypothetical protein [Pseudorhodobacter ferrugineus]|nr:hypothetical protein [Pseudorhodobacter ferrugineus]